MFSRRRTPLNVSLSCCVWSFISVQRKIAWWIHVNDHKTKTTCNNAEQKIHLSLSYFRPSRISNLKVRCSLNSAVSLLTFEWKMKEESMWFVHLPIFTYLNCTHSSSFLRSLLRFSHPWDLIYILWRLTSSTNSLIRWSSLFCQHLERDGSRLFVIRNLSSSSSEVDGMVWSLM
jgi:hypothetical protein